MRKTSYRNLGIAESRFDQLNVEVWVSSRGMLGTLEGLRAVPPLERFTTFMR